mgnify:FL=1|jgi:thiol-disulfide isomerase/thioredoxin|tara:strand:- start:415 stop:927 length:513 start_codon:yes stop_codon:yes gene_type:complete
MVLDKNIAILYSMANLINVLSKYIAPHKKKIIIALVLVIFILVSMYFMKVRFNKEGMDELGSDVANEIDREKEAVIYFFHVDWCPHCKTALPEWNAFKSEMNDKTINGYAVKCMDMDCTDENGANAKVASQYNIESYPTVKLIKDSNEIDFDSKISSTALSGFVDTMLGK